MWRKGWKKWDVETSVPWEVCGAGEVACMFPPPLPARMKSMQSCLYQFWQIQWSSVSLSEPNSCCFCFFHGESLSWNLMMLSCVCFNIFLSVTASPKIIEDIEKMQSLCDISQKVICFFKYPYQSLLCLLTTIEEVGKINHLRFWLRLPCCRWTFWKV